MWNYLKKHFWQFLKSMNKFLQAILIFKILEIYKHLGHNKNMNNLLEHLDNALNIYTGEQYRETLIEAKQDFFKITGNLNDDDDDYDLWNAFI